MILERACSAGGLAWVRVHECREFIPAATPPSRSRPSCGSRCTPRSCWWRTCRPGRSSRWYREGRCAHLEVGAAAPLRPVNRVDGLVVAGYEYGSARYWQEALRVARLQPEEEVRGGGVVGAVVAAAAVPLAAGVLAPRADRPPAHACEGTPAHRLVAL